MNRFLNQFAKFPYIWRIIEVPMFCVLLALSNIVEHRYISAGVWIALGIFRGITEYRCDSTTISCKCKK